MNSKQTKYGRFLVVLQITLVTFVLTLTVRASGEVDTTFNAAVQETTTGSVERIVVQPDGKLLVAGNFTIAGNTARSNIARLNADGTVDSTFEPPDFYKFFSLTNATTLTNVFIRAVAVQSDGKILVGGLFSGVTGTQKISLLRLNVDGSLDSTFSTALVDGGVAFYQLYDIKIQADNRILISGNFFLTQNGTTRVNLARLNSDGSVDASFAQAVSSAAVPSFALQSDGKIVYASADGNTGRVSRLNADGTADKTFPDAIFNGPGVAGGYALTRIIIQPDGKILVGGRFTSVNSFPQNNIARLNTDGSLDISFNSGGSGATEKVYGIALLPDGKIVIGGFFDNYNNNLRRRTARLNADGSLDTSFNYTPGQNVIINDIQSLGDGRIVVGGSDSAGSFDKLARINANGSVDSTFAGAVYQRGSVVKLLTQPDGKILVAGTFRKINGVSRLHVARLNADGSVDTTFNANIVNNTPLGIVTAIGLQPDGKIVIGGQFSIVINQQNFRTNLARLTTDGSLDTTFSAAQFSGTRNFEELIVLADGKILLAVDSLGVGNVVRLTANGATDSTFVTTIAGDGTSSSNSLTIIRSMKLQPDGKIVIAGEFINVNGASRVRIARLNADGVLDNTFNPQQGANGNINDFAIQSDGKIVIGGEFLAINGSAIGTRPYIARLLPDGTVDTTFASSANNHVHVIERQADDKILLGGVFSQINGVSRNRLARLNANGSFDNSFVGTGANDIVRVFSMQTDGKILVGGEFTRINGMSAVSVARLLNTPTAVRTAFDFDGDGRADIAVFRPSNGNWYQLRSANNAFNAVTFGQSNDRIAPADYDGDGKTDIAVFRDAVPGAGNFAYFYILNSADNSFRPVQFGATGDVPVAGDWDGDGKADLAVYREGAAGGGPSYFYYRPSSQPSVNFNQILWGGAGDKPLVGDFDGDGKLDAAVFRPSTAGWFILQSSNNAVLQTNFGVSTDIPVPADFDGDGKANIAVFRPSTGTWFTSTSAANNYGAIPFGAAGDLPVPADYDGDGRADVAVYRPSTGAWYLQRSTQGFTGVAFGDGNDLPIPNAFIR